MIKINNLSKSFNGKPVLQNINLTIPDGKTMVIVGQSGCGKTVLLRSIIGLMHPDSGSILINNKDITKMSQSELFQVRLDFGMLFQGAALFDSMTVRENVGLALNEHTTLSREQISEKVDERLSMVGLDTIGDKYPSELSGGMKKRVGLARALIMDPKYVLYDEPTTGLDPIMSEQINKLIMDTHSQLDVTSIIVTHDMHSAFTVGDIIAMIVDGRVIFCGTVDEFQSSDHEYVKRFAVLQFGAS
ncbi:ABC transporter ATP-binding protein [bacterium]|nr:ABC transporter ATP-binding protein [bacterium]